MRDLSDSRTDSARERCPFRQIDRQHQRGSVYNVIVELLIKLTYLRGNRTRQASVRNGMHTWRVFFCAEVGVYGEPACHVYLKSPLLPLSSKSITFDHWEWRFQIVEKQNTGSLTSAIIG